MSFSLSIYLVSEQRWKEGAVGCPPLLRDLLPRGHPELNGASLGRNGSRFPFLRGRGGARGLLPLEFGVRWVAGCSLRAGEQLRALRSLPEAAGARGRGAPGPLPRPSCRGRRAAGHDPPLCSDFQVYLCPFQFSVTLRKGETKQKSLYFFSGLVK